jgi:hypothetical protein
MVEMTDTAYFNSLEYQNSCYPAQPQGQIIHVPTQLINVGEEPMKLATTQKAFIVYARAKGAQDELITIALTLGWSVDTLDWFIKTRKLVIDYDPANDEDDEDKKDA